MSKKDVFLNYDPYSQRVVFEERVINSFVDYLKQSVYNDAKEAITFIEAHIDLGFFDINWRNLPQHLRYIWRWDGQPDYNRRGDVDYMTSFNWKDIKYVVEQLHTISKKVRKFIVMTTKNPTSKDELAVDAIFKQNTNSKDTDQWYFNWIPNECECVIIIRELTDYLLKNPKCSSKVFTIRKNMYAIQRMWERTHG